MTRSHPPGGDTAPGSAGGTDTGRSAGSRACGLGLPSHAAPDGDLVPRARAAHHADRDGAVRCGLAGHDRRPLRRERNARRPHPASGSNRGGCRDRRPRDAGGRGSVRARRPRSVAADRPLLRQPRDRARCGGAVALDPRQTGRGRAGSATSATVLVPAEARRGAGLGRRLRRDRDRRGRRRARRLGARRRVVRSRRHAGGVRLGARTLVAGSAPGVVRALAGARELRQACERRRPCARRHVRERDGLRRPGPGRGDARSVPVHVPDRAAPARGPRLERDVRAFSRRSRGSQTTRRGSSAASCAQFAGSA